MEKSIANEKTHYRRKYRKIREEIPVAERHAADTIIAETVMARKSVAAARVIFVYLSRSGEVDTTHLVKQFLKQGKRVLVPSPDISALPHDGLFRVSDMDANSPERCHESRLDEIDLIIVPGIVWDPDGSRIGFGGGYFDRLLSMARPDCQKIGLAYQCQMVDSLPRETWDEHVNIVITEKQVYRNPPD